MNIKGVAKLAGVSTATVSRVLNKTAPVDARTERRVRNAIERTGYFPNTHARMLGSAKSQTYGLIISDIANPFFPELVKSFEHLAVDHNHEVLIGNTDYHPERMEQCVRRMLEHKVAGVAIMTSEMDSKLVLMLSKRQIPIVFLDTGKAGSLTSNISIDYQHGIDLAIDHLVSLKHRSIAFIQGPVNFKSAMIRRDAFISSLKRDGIKIGEDFIRTGNHSIDGGRRAMDELLALENRPTAVMCSNDLTAIGVLIAAHIAGFRVPEDISVIGFDDIELSSLVHPPLTTIRVSRTEIATRAFSALYGATNRTASRGTNHTIPTDLIIRQSTGPSSR
ncbi:LacI family DNA-binding transcriptional regulator [Edaphobacter sp. 12200R-103]|jgi:DNA-binding LacI/PurR family transcriptional regulator|uniref:LacI family DNA-binding transcriptional regulator n=1 Tax=Edaphobacter sp. 12200R-103 TaxID=2703788 RepID=UPI00138CEE2F|nr:LacI family DNA-binding transcriptional regulator [Edaphobacter sp. 12200R-103]QHS51364.1 LacI family transcriptional regulator [Edaphobacter sp. 12200R-103]